MEFTRDDVAQLIVLMKKTIDASTNYTQALKHQIEYLESKINEIMVIDTSKIPESIVGIKAKVKYAKENNLFIYVKQ